MEMTETTRAWIDALRSGQYPQGKNKLLIVESGVKSYCCLGVGQFEVLGCEPVFDSSDSTEDDISYYGAITPPDKLTNSCDCEDCIEKNEVTHGYPDELMKATGMTDDESGTLTRLNDDGYSFSDIADKIEEMTRS